eukprot:TRINITY_DN11529_c0_g1_i2.p1 TRINITY_DN11529_c0_g1~~TRINITY_DN11529_c0_g1_i2.p1  ORF type:complete len:267 (-),score=33.22 TRINITY_DN11529_c0_g1_i2:41-841(-)
MSDYLVLWVSWKTSQAVDKIKESLNKYASVGSINDVGGMLGDTILEIKELQLKEDVFKPLKAEDVVVDLRMERSITKSGTIICSMKSGRIYLMQEKKGIPIGTLEKGNNIFKFTQDGRVIDSEGDLGIFKEGASGIVKFARIKHVHVERREKTRFLQVLGLTVELTMPKEQPPSMNISLDQHNESSHMQGIEIQSITPQIIDDFSDRSTLEAERWSPGSLIFSLVALSATLIDGPSVLSLIHISEPTRRTPISYAVFCLKKKKQRQ